VPSPRASQVVMTALVDVPILGRAVFGLDQLQAGNLLVRFLAGVPVGALAGGFLAGRTIWLDAIRTHFPDLAAVSAALNKESVAILNSLSKLTKERAHSWQPRFPTFDHVQREGDFARAY